MEPDKREVGSSSLPRPMKNMRPRLASRRRVGHLVGADLTVPTARVVSVAGLPDRSRRRLRRGLALGLHRATRSHRYPELGGVKCHSWRRASKGSAVEARRAGR